MSKFQEVTTSDQEVINPMHDKSAYNPNFTDSDIATATDNAIKNCKIITEAMRFDSVSAAQAFNSIKDILENKGTENKDKKTQIANVSRVIEDTALQVYANMAIGMLGSSEEKEAEAEARRINKLNTAFDFLDPENIVEDNNPKDKRLADMAGAYASLMTDTEIDEKTKESIETAFKLNPDIFKIAKIQEDLYNKDSQELEGEELEKNTPIDDLRNSSTYDGEDWENFKRKAILSAKGAIAIGLLFAPGGIFLVPLFLYATKNFGADPEKLEKEQDEEAKELKAQETSKILNAFRNYLPDQKGERQEEGDEQDQDLVTANEPETLTGEKAEKFVEKENGSLTRTQRTLEVNKDSLNRVGESQKTDASVYDDTVIKNTAKSVGNSAVEAALKSIAAQLRETKIEENGDEAINPKVIMTSQQVVGGAREP
jgi:hypothetical protein